MAETIEVVRADSAALREEIYQLRYAVYVEERSKTFDHVDHDRHRLTDEFDEAAMLLAARVNGTTVGTLRINCMHDTKLSDETARAFELERFLSVTPAAAISSTSRFVIAPAWRASGVASALTLAAYRWMLDRGIRFDLIHCAPGLIGHYERLGYRRFTANFAKHDTGLNVPMTLVGRDFDHLARVGSPLLAAVDERRGDDDDAGWLREAFPLAATYTIRRTISEDEFWSGLATEGDPVNVTSSLFAGLSAEQIRSFSRSAVTHRFRAGEQIICDGGSGDEMYVILQGLVDVLGSEHGRSVILRTLGPGDVVGEMALFNRSLRGATVIATCDVAALVLTHGALVSAIRSAPDLAARVLLNLGRVLSERLDRMSRELTQSRVRAIVS